MRGTAPQILRRTRPPAPELRDQFAADLAHGFVETLHGRRREERVENAAVRRTYCPQSTQRPTAALHNVSLSFAQIDIQFEDRDEVTRGFPGQPIERAQSGHHATAHL